MKLLLVILLLASLAIPQTPQVKPSPCVDADLKVAAAEASAAKSRALAEACLLHAEIAHTEHANVGRELAAEQKKSASLAVSYKKSLAEKDAVIAKLTVERDATLLQIKKANGTNLCKFLSVGCVGR